MKILPRFFIYANELLNNSILYKKLLSNMQSIESLGELNAKLLAENDELKDKNTEIPELRRKFAEIETERAKLKVRIAELLKQGVKENKRRDNAELRDRVTKVEQRQMQNNNVTKNMLDCETDNTNTKSLEDGKTMLSWDEVHKKKVSNEIRQRKREEKFQRESSDHKQENIGYNNSSNDSGERIPEESIHSEDVKMTLCYQNDAIPPGI
ncbi:hypothetical protein RhiirB3_519470 [Rhizophagus irregularis]|nr:hypothetical protein RhiirB3_519470 [Rhizophagus irregularis]